MKKKKIVGVIPITVVLLFLYILIFSKSTGKEFVLKPVWKIDLEQENTIIPFTKDDDIGFRLKNTFGFINLDGNLYFKEQIQDNVAISAGGFINYSNVQNNEQSLVFFNPVGEFINSYPLTGYPLFEHNRIFLVDTNGSGLRECDEKGNILWRVAFSKLITTLSVNNELVCIGFANGLLQLFDKKGQSVYSLAPERSRISIVLGAALNHAGDKIAMVYGIEPQYLVLIEKNETKYLPPKFFELTTNFRKEVFLKFTDNSQYLFVEGNNSLLNFNVKTKKSTVIPFLGKFQSFSVSNDSKLCSVISREADNYNLQLFLPDKGLIVTSRLKAEYVFNQLIDNHLLLGLDNKLIRLDLLEM